MDVSLFNCTGKNEVDFGWVGEEDHGGWFFPMPAGLYATYGHVLGTTTLAAVDAAINALEDDEVDHPAGLDRHEAIEEVRAALDPYVREAD